MKLRRRAPNELRSAEVSLDTSAVSALLGASQAVNSAMGLEEALRVVLITARTLLEAHEGSVMLLGSEGTLRIVASDGIPAETAATAQIRLGEGVAGRVAQSGLPALINVTPDKRDFESFVHPERALTSAVSVPLSAGGRTVGVLNLNLVSGGRSFGDRDLRLAQVFGEQAATAIHKAQLLDAAQRRGGDLELLLEGSRALIGILELEPLLTRVLDGAIKIAGARAGFVTILDEGKRELTLGVYQGLAKHDIRDVLGDQNFLGLFRSEIPAALDVRDLPPLAALVGEDENALGLPMRAEGRTKALLLLIGQRPSGDRLSLCQTFAAQAGLAIRNAQLYMQVGDKEAELASIVYSTDSPIVVVDSAAKLMIANPAAEEVLGFSIAFQKGRPVSEAINEPVLLRLLSGIETDEQEISAGVPVPRVYKARVSTLKSPQPASAGRMLVLTDITQVREVERMKSDFVAIIGHELRTPLTLIKGYVRTLLRRGAAMTPEQLSESLTIADAQAQRLERLIEDLLYVSKIETTRPALHPENSDLAPLVTELLEEFKAREPQRSFTLIGPSSLPITLDRSKIQQVVFHLLDNACKYSEETTPITLELQEHPDEASVSVIDRGVGIVSEDLKTLFERFRQVDSSSTREHGGTGVGLYLCKSFVEAHGGKITVQSMWGKGSTFMFTIPRRLEAEEKTIEVRHSAC